uniref:multidrug ABC transporter permease/ATP-binding protein n=1 Tax=Thaumasiovibrio occultus TaxID=1891184 RepID=UPI000B35DE10|nr:multidrug ABC transporter permease/ATP-binding protein [Thaumasiovibrio occultus]
MKIIRQLMQGQVGTLLMVSGLSLLSAALSVAVIAFIQSALATPQAMLDLNMAFFSALLIALFISASLAQVVLHRLGHQFVYNKRCDLIKQLINTDIEQLEAIGGARILAALSTDVRHITVAFVHLPALIYGSILVFFAFAYLAWLNLPLFLVTLVVLGIGGFIGFGMVSRISAHIRKIRSQDDAIYRDYQAIIEGRKELSLNPQRARRYYSDMFEPNAQSYRDEITQADTLHGLTGNMTNTLVLGLIGLNYYLAFSEGWATVGQASIFALVILYLRAPLMSAVGAIPAFIAATVSLRKLDALGLHSHTQLALTNANTESFQSLQLHQVRYQYQAENGDVPFQVGPLDFSVQRGEVVFITGGNGSGKSTLARLLSGLFRPHSGEAYLNQALVTSGDWHELRCHFSSVFSDFYLFRQVVDSEGETASDEEMRYWLQHLGMAEKVSVAQGQLSQLQVSQGQRKRLALILALAEQRGCLLLDEWAADQDPAFRAVFYRELLPLLKARNITVIAITHDDRYFDCADRHYHMEAGLLTEYRFSANEAVRGQNTLS